MNKFRRDFPSEWMKTDKRSKWNRHWKGKHTKECHKYSQTWFGDICKYTGEYLRTNTDLDKINSLDQISQSIK